MDFETMVKLAYEEILSDDEFEKEAGDYAMSHRDLTPVQRSAITRAGSSYENYKKITGKLEGGIARANSRIQEVAEPLRKYTNALNTMKIEGRANTPAFDKVSERAASLTQKKHNLNKQINSMSMMKQHIDRHKSW